MAKQHRHVVCESDCRQLLHLTADYSQQRWPLLNHATPASKAIQLLLLQSASTAAHRQPYTHLALVSAGVPLLHAALNHPLLNYSNLEALLLERQRYHDAQSSATHDNIKVWCWSVC